MDSGTGAASAGLDCLQRLTDEQIFAQDLELDRQSAAEVASALRPGILSPNKVAITGEEGHFFVADGASRWEQQFRGELTIPATWFEGWTRVLESRSNVAAALGVTLCNIVIPEKQVLLPEKRWPAGDVDGERRPLKQLLARLGSDVPMLYAADSMLARKGSLALYFRHNSHWTPSGCCLAMRDLAARLEAQVDWSALRFSYRISHLSHDLSAHFFQPPPRENVGLLEAPVERYFEDAPTEPGRNTGSAFGLRNPDAPDPRRLIIFGDSYSWDMGVAFVLAEVFADVVFIWSKNVDWTLVDKHGAEVVVWESAERFLATVAES